MSSYKAFVKYVIFLCLILSIVAIAFLASVPPVSKDALVHHLAVPKLYLNHGGIYEIPSMDFSYYPMNLDLLYLIPLYFGNDILPKIIHFFFGLLTSWVIFDYLKSRLNHIYALGGALFFISIPIIVKLSISVYVDLGLLFFTTTALILLLKWFDNIERPLPFILSAICCGLAMGTKYNGLVGFIILMAFVPMIYVRYTKSEKFKGIKSIGIVLGYGVIALIVFSPWMIRNYLWTNNPVYPLYDNWFNAGSSLPGFSLGIFAYREILYQESWLDMVLLPIRVFFQGQDGNPQYFDGKLNPFLLIFGVFAFLRGASDPENVRFDKKILLLFATLFFLFSLFSTGLRIRYILPILSPLVILATYGVKNLVTLTQNHFKLISGKFLFVLVICAVSGAYLINTHYVYDQFKIVKPFDYISGKLTRDQYIKKFRPEYPAMQYISQKLPADSKILFFYIGRRGYYCDREYTFDMVNMKSTFKKYIKTMNSPIDIYNALNQGGITHFLIKEDIFNRYVKQEFSELEQKKIILFFRHYIKRVYERNGFSLYKIRENF